MPFKVFRFWIHGDDIANARDSNNLKWITFEFALEGASNRLRILYMDAVGKDGSTVGIPYHAHSGGSSGNYEDTTLAEFISRPYKITEEMLAELDARHPRKSIKRITCVAKSTPYRHDQAHEDPRHPYPLDRNREFIQLSVDIDY